MRYAYYPGCTLKNYADNLEATALAVLKKLGLEVVELSKWNCCGTVYSLADDDLVHQIAPMRVLLNAQKEGFDRVLCVCSMCYNTLAQTALMLKNNPDKQRTLNLFLDDEPDYLGNVQVVHLLQVLRDDVGIDRIRKMVVRPLSGLKVAPYYGCLLVRPREVAIDDTEHPVVIEQLLSVLGATVIDDPLKVECCGSHQTVHNKDVVADRAYAIINSARSRGAQAVTLDCPLCDFNLDHRQKESEEKYTDFFPMPVLYYTQLMAMAMGIKDDIYGFDKHYVNPKPMLKEHNLV